MSAKFLTPLRFEKVGAQSWLLTDDLVFRSMKLPGLFIVPRGFQTDLASIPRIAWAIFPKEDLYDPAAVLHDGGYGNALKTPGDERIFLVKEWCDSLFLEAMLAVGVPPWRANLMYRAVRRWGDPVGHPLADNTKEQAEAADTLTERRQAEGPNR